MAEFYVKSKDGKLVPAQYLRDKGVRIPNPNPLPKGNEYFDLYDRNGNKLKVEDQNAGKYYIVPEGYSLDDARHFSDEVRQKIAEKEGIGALALMGKAFYIGGSQDRQRQYTYADGAPGNRNDPVPAFQHATSFILGFVTARSGIPLQLAERVGGWVNLWSWAHDSRVDIGGPLYNNPRNARSIEHGFTYWRMDAFPPDRAYLDKQRQVTITENNLAPRKSQIGLNVVIRGKPTGGRDVQLASYRYAPSGDSMPTTETAAVQALNAAKADDAFTKRYMSGERDAVERMHALHRAAYPERGDETVGPAVRSDASDTSADGFSSEKRNLTSARQALEAAKSDSGFVKRYLDGDRSSFDHMQSLIQAAYPEPVASADIGSVSGASTPMLRSWTPETATEGLAPWMQSSLRDFLSSSPEYEGDEYSKLAPWTREQYPAWLRGNGG